MLESKYFQHNEGREADEANNISITERGLSHFGGNESNPLRWICYTSLVNMKRQKRHPRREQSYRASSCNEGR
ncbi:Uncharacterized protein TCM_006920 [Theobroma cacao]|uniref:Uncharacterized protein n=1 Tax=Theobroma cacao TaxID=3641 RepID=A0A061E099_THECC|nr:Uncharacterized protein TCM_006920 [Theobroma cacao]